MLNSLIIGFREVFEMVLVIVPLLIYVKKNEENLSKYIYLGMIFGIVTSLVSGIFIYSNIIMLTGRVKEVFLGAMSLFLAALVLYNIIILSFKGKNYNVDIRTNYNFSLTGISLLILSFITIFRESIEIIIFVLPSMIISPLGVIVGLLIGLLLAVTAGFIIFKAGVNINISIIFGLLSIMLIFIGGAAFGEGLEGIFTGYDNISLFGELIFILPLLYLFLKKWLKRLAKRP